jgi:phosphoenolpyruvate carboxylase
MAAYAGLVEDADLRDRFLARILAERDRTVAVLSDIYGGPLDVQRPNIARTLELRKPGLEVLHRRQVDGLRTWRALTAVGDPAAQTMLDELLLTVNAIASGLDATG